MNDLILEKNALSFRTEQGLSNNDPIRLKSLLQKLNVITVFAPLTDKFSGMALKVEQGQIYRFMLVNNTQSLGKQHFTICHELYHLYIQQHFNSHVCQTGLFNKKANKEEYNADVFASYLLLPSDGLLENIPNEELAKGKISLRTILFLEHFYSCSRRALLYRLKKMDFITSAEYDNFSHSIKKGALEYGYQTDLYEPANNGIVIGDYGGLAKDLFDNENISQSHYYSLLTDLGIDITKFDEISNCEY
jgi:Zn-dependent peptidase ImmA (M78 family)